MATIKLRCPRAANALYFTEDGEATTILVKHGLVITNKGIEFPEFLVNSLLWRVGMAWEILYYEERKWQTSDEINEMKALAGLMLTLQKLGGVQEFEFDDAGNYTGDAFTKTETDGPEVTTVVIPKAFYRDHVKRANEGGLIVKETKELMTVELTEPAFDDLFSDARHYAQCGVNVYGADFIGIVSSAQATYRRLKAYKEAGLVWGQATKAVA